MGELSSFFHERHDGHRHETLCNLPDSYVRYNTYDFADMIADHLYADAMVRNAIRDNGGTIVCIFF